jgi:hypothetical protein
MELASQMDNLRSFVHVSTYFVNNHMPRNSVVKEALHPVPLELNGQAVGYKAFVDGLMAMSTEDANRTALDLMAKNNFNSSYAFGASVNTACALHNMANNVMQVASGWHFQDHPWALPGCCQHQCATAQQACITAVQACSCLLLSWQQHRQRPGALHCPLILCQANLRPTTSPQFCCCDGPLSCHCYETTLPLTLCCTACRCRVCPAGKHLTELMVVETPVKAGVQTAIVRPSLIAGLLGDPYPG